MADLFRVVGDRMEPVTESTLVDEGLTEPRHLESWVASQRSIFERTILWVRRQGSLDGGRSDLVGLDSNGDLLLVELKRGEVTDDALTQALRYAAEYARFDRTPIAEWLGEYEGDATADTGVTDSPNARITGHLGQSPINQAQVILLVGESFSATTLRVADYVNGALAAANPPAFSVECWRVGLRVDHDHQHVVVTRMLPTDQIRTLIEERQAAAQDAKYGTDTERRDLRIRLQQSAALQPFHPHGVQGGKYVFDVALTGLTTPVRVGVYERGTVTVALAGIGARWDPATALPQRATPVPDAVTLTYGATDLEDVSHLSEDVATVLLAVQSSP